MLGSMLRQRDRSRGDFSDGLPAVAMATVV
jgi:hypothetical protein